MIIWKAVNDTEGRSFPFDHPADQAQSPIRKCHYANSRQALILCLKEGASQLFPFSDINQLKVNKHHNLEACPEILVSLAHTRGLAAACMAYKSSTTIGVGIDCEHKGRAFRPEILSKFSDENDKADSPLHLWCAKEAAFKATSYFWNKEKVFILKDIQVRDRKFQINNLLEGSISFEEHGDYLLAIAVINQLLI